MTIIDFEEALRNIDVFCKVLAKKMVEEESEHSGNNALEPMEKLLQKKYVVEGNLRSPPLVKSLIPLPHVEEPLIDVFGDNNYIRILVQCRCEEQIVTVHTDIDGIAVCKKECYINEDGTEVCAEKCQKLDVYTKCLKIENMTTTCRNNSVFEIDIPKATSDISI